MKRILILIILLLVCVYSPVQAQIAPDINLNSTPFDPQPLQKVTITAESFGVNLDQASISWRYNGSVIDSGIGRKNITVTAPTAGATGIITMTASGADFSSTTTTLLLRPASMDILWEATDSYTPPFYKGKALASVSSTIRATAIASSSAPKQLVYTWSKNDTVLGSLSGYGKSSILFKNNILDSTEKISLSAQGGTFTGSASITLTPGNPSLVVYQKDEGFIDYANGSSTELSTNQGGLILRIEPFFFSVPNTLSKGLAFTVRQGEIDITNNTTPNELYLSAPDTKGSSLFSIAITTLSYTLQNLTRNFTINFN